MYKCKNKKCLRPLPDGYKHKYCENCRNEHIKKYKNVGKTVFSGIIILGSAIVTKGRIHKK